MQNIVRVTKALADRQRIRILMWLLNGELCVCQIVELLKLAPSTVSKHLSILSAAGLLDYRKEGRWIYYHLPKANSDNLPLVQWLSKSLKGNESFIEDMKSLEKVRKSNLEVICRKYRPS